MAISSPIMLKLIGTGDASAAFFAQTIMGVALSFWGSPMMAWLAESFEPAARLTSVSIGYNIAQACGGGMAPAIATEMVDRLGPESPGFYLTVIACIALVGLLCVAPRKAVHFTILEGEDNDDYEDSREEQDDSTTDRELFTIT